MNMPHRLLAILVAACLASTISCGGYGDDGYSAPTSPESRDTTSASDPPGEPGSPY